MSNSNLLYFEKDAQAALALAKLLGTDPKLITRHDFPDGEFKLQLPVALGEKAIIFLSLDHPNEKLIELLFLARTARLMGVKHLTLVAPYLAYMRQDIAFYPGEVVSQKIVGEFLASLFDAVITVDPHLHRIARLEAAIPIERAVAISAAPILGKFVAKERNNPLLIGPDAESEQWVQKAAYLRQLDYAVAKKIRHGDSDVEIQLPSIDVAGRCVVLMDDIASTGRTLAMAAQLLLEAGAKSVDVAITHALFGNDVFMFLKQSGIANVWSTDTVLHPTNAVSILPAIADAIAEPGSIN